MISKVYLTGIIHFSSYWLKGRPFN